MSFDEVSSRSRTRRSVARNWSRELLLTSHGAGCCNRGRFAMTSCFVAKPQLFSPRPIFLNSTTKGTGGNDWARLSLSVTLPFNFAAGI